MAGQGITVSIQAKIEGWQDQIKQIQNAMKNIKPGTDISKGLIKDLQQVNDMVNNLGKNMNQRLTSDSQITSFVDKIMNVEEVFNRLGTSMAHISFGDIKPEYITAGFKDLLQTLEQANNALGQGMESSFQNAIANSKILQKEFERMKIDPKSMNINAIQEALSERGKALEKDVNEGLKKLTDFEKGLEKLKNTRDELAARNTFLGKDANATVQSLLVGHQLPTKGTILDADELEKQVSFFRSNLLKAGFTPTQLNHIIPDLETVMKAGHWDEMPSKFAEYLREAQNRTKNSLEKASQEYRDAIVQHQRMSGAQSHLSSLRFNNTQAQNEVSNILSGTVQNDTRSLRDTVGNLRQQFEQAVTSGFKGLGSKLFSSSQQGMQDASAAMKDYSAALDQVKAKEQAVNKVQGVVQRYFSIYAAVRMVSKGIRSMMTNIKDLDKTITEIAIVTKMNQNDLWGQMPQYTKLAKQYAASISGVYKVSQLYYQQGLGQQDVMALTEQTLKMARISGLDYAEATDYMTNAVRSFKMEMTDAATVVDVYSAVAASSASSVTELATAMSKTASSAAAVGSSFENTTAMLAVMIEATRESPENIGSAMKSIISRYGELKENKTGIDEEGEEYSLNKVDKALQTVGISIHDANGEFRDFDDVIMELSEKWNTIDKNTQRYIATVMAGNRQQSRFLALVSSAERLKEESAKAANSEDASQLQFLKTMDSIEAKTQQFQTSLQSLYTSSGLENLYKGLLDFGNEFANTLESIGGKQGLVGVISNIGASFVNMATFATTGFSAIKTGFMNTRKSIEAQSRQAGLEYKETQAWNAYNSLVANPVTGKGRKVSRYNKRVEAARQAAMDSTTEKEADKAAIDKQNALLRKQSTQIGWGMAASAAGMALSTWANSLDINKDRKLKSGLTIGSSALSGLGTGLMVGASVGGPLGALVGVLTALPGVISGVGMWSESTEERINRLQKNITDTKNTTLQSKDDLKTLVDYKKKYEELNKTQFESAEKQKEFKKLQNEIAEKYPSLISSMDAEGNALVNMNDSYNTLLKTKQEVYTTNFLSNLGAELTALQDIDYVMSSIYNKTPQKSHTSFFGLIKKDNYDQLYQRMQTSLIAQDGRNVSAAASQKAGLGDTGFDQLTDNDLTRMFFKENDSYLKELFADQARAYSGEFVYTDLDTVSKLSGGWRDVIGAVYSDIVNYVANTDQPIYDAIKAFNTDEIYDQVFNAADENTQAILSANQEAYKQMITDATTNFGDTEFASLVQVKAGTKYAQDLTDSTIRSKNTAYIQSLNDIYENVSGETTSTLQQVALRKYLDQGLQNFLKNSEKYYNNNNYRYYDETSGEYRKFIKGYDDGKLLEAYYTGKGVYDNNGNVTSLDSNLGINDAWYAEQIAKYSYLNTDKVNDIYNELGQNTRENIVSALGENLSEAEQAVYKNLEEWLNTKDNRTSFTENADEAIKTFKTLYKDNNLSDDQIQQMATTLMILQDSFDEQYQNTIDRYTNWTTSLSDSKDAKISNETIQRLTKFKQQFGVQYLSGIQDQFKTILKNTDLTDIQKEGQIKNLIDVFDIINRIPQSTIKNSVLQKVQSADFTSITGIYSLIETLSDIDDFDLDTDTNGKELKQKLKNLGKDLRINIESEINSYFDSMESAAEGFDKALSSAASGMDLKSAKEMADKLDIGLEDFTIKEGKFFYDDFNKIQKAYTIDIEESFSSLKENLTTRYARLGEKQDHWLKTSAGWKTSQSLVSGTLKASEIQDLFNTTELQEQFSKRFNIDYSEFIDYYEQYKEYINNFKGEGSPLSLVEWLGNYVNEEMAKSVKALEEWQKQSQAISELKNGQFEGFLKTTGEWKDTTQLKETLTNLQKAGAPSIALESIKQQIEDLDKINTELIDAISEGDASKLSEENQKKYGKLVRDTYKAVQSSFVTSIFDAMEGGTTALEVTEVNQKYLQGKKDWLVEGTKIEDITAGQQVQLDLNKILSDESNLWDVIYNSYNNEKDRLEAFKNYHDKKYSKNKLTALEGITDGEIAYSDFLDYLTTNRGWSTEELFTKNKLASEMKTYGLAMTATGDYVVENWSQYVTQLTDDLNYLLESGMTPDGKPATIQDINRARARVAQAQRGQQPVIEQAASDILDNYNDVSIEQQQALADALGVDSAVLEDLLYKDGLDGKKHLDVSKFKSLISQYIDNADTIFSDSYSSIADDYLKNITEATSYVTNGTTSKSDMDAFKLKAQQLGLTLSQDVFTYDSILEAWTLDPEVLHSYVKAQAQQLIKTGDLTVDDAKKYINDNVIKQLASTIDIESFLDAENKQGLARDQLKQQLKSSGLLDYDKYISDAIRQMYLERANYYINSAAEWTDKYNTPEELATTWIHKNKTLIDTAKEKAAENFVSIIENGGKAAVIAMEELAVLKGEELTSADIEKAYLAQITPLQNSLEQLSYGIGSIVSGKTIELLNDTNYTLQNLGNGSAVITSLGDISKAYKNYYDALVATNEATLAELNDAYAKVLETQDGKAIEQRAIDALGEASGMTYSTLGQILSDAGLSLEKNLEDLSDIIESTGGNKIRITDFAAFARRMKWDYNSEEYISAFKTYNDGLIERNTQVKNNITEELQGLKDIKPGDWLNLTYTEKALKKISKDNSKEIAKYRDIQKQYGKENTEKATEYLQILEEADPFSSLQYALADLGAYFDDGILKTVEGADLAGIFSTLFTKLNEVAANIDIDISEIQDAFSDLLDAFIDSIINGIKGGLKHKEANDLITTARGFGVELADTDFTETADGLKLSYQAAAKLYYNVSKVNAAKGKLVFDELNSSLQESDSRFKDLTSIMGVIRDLTNEINELKPQEDKAAQERIAAAEKELQLAKEIQLVRLSTQNEDWNIKDKGTVATSTENIIKYVGDTVEVIQKGIEWNENGYIPVSDIYDISDYVTGASQLADARQKAVQWYGVNVGGETGITESEFQSALQASITYDTDEEGNVRSILDPTIFNEALKNIAGKYGFADNYFGSFDISKGVSGFEDTQKIYGAEAERRGTELSKVTDFFNDADYASKALLNQWVDANDLLEDGTIHFENIGDESEEGKAKRERFKKSFLMAAEHMSDSNGTTLSDAIESGEKLSQEQERMYTDLVSLMTETSGWDSSDLYASAREMIQKYNVQSKFSIGDYTFQMSGNKLLVYNEESKKYVLEDGTEFENANDALEHMGEQELEDLQKTFASYEPPKEGTTENQLKLPGTDYSIKAEGDHFILVDENGNAISSTTYDTAEAALQGSRTEKIKELDKQLQELSKTPNTAEQQRAILEEQTVLASMSDEGYSEWIKSGLKAEGRWAEGAKEGKTSYGQITSEVRSKLTEGGWTAESLAKEANRLWHESKLDSSQAAAEFKIKTGIDIDPSTVPDAFTAVDFTDYIQQLDLTQAAADVMSGVTAAFTATGEGSVTQSLSSAIAGAFANQEGLEIPSLEIKPSSVTLAAEATASIGDVSVTADKITIDGTVEPISPDQIPPGEGTVTYTNEEPKKLPLQKARGVINWDNNVVIPTNLTAEGTINWKNNWTKPNTSDSDDGGGGSNTNSNQTKATGNVNIGSAYAKGTLMGELGPELVVQNGRYFVAGQNGAEFVDLANDAIVFNHLQTERLFKNGMSPDRGKAVTNERVAAAFAHGNWNGGEAKGTVSGTISAASADLITNPLGPYYKGMSDAYSAVKESEEIKNTTTETAEQAKNFIDKLERWYNWLQRIAHLEKEINIEEAKRTRYASDMIPHGKEYFTSQLASLEALKEQLAVQKDLNAQRSKYFETLRKELNSGAFSILYEFDDTFQPKYKEGMYEFMRKLLEADWYKTGAPNNEAKSIYDQLRKMGFESMMQYDSSGNKINKEKEGWENQAVQAFVERYKKGLEEGQKYHDEILEGEQRVEELIDAENQILKEIEDNQISVENKVLKAIEDMRQQEIDNLKDEKDAIEKSANTLIDGLNDQLDRERSLYQNQQNVDELNALQRRLGILQRSGGSASEIADLQAQIQEKQYDNYFDAQELQIQAIQDASDAEIQRLDNQITLMEETLAYEKEHGLLWDDVNTVLKGTAQDIVDFISGNTTEYWSKSSTELKQVIRNDLFEVERFKQYQASVEGGMDALVAMYGENATESEHKTTEASNTTITDDTSGNSGGGSSNNINHSKVGLRRNQQGMYNADEMAAMKYGQYYGSTSGGDLVYYQTADGRVGIVRGKDQKGAYYNLDQMEEMIGSEIIATASSYGWLPAVKAAAQDKDVKILEDSLFTKQSGGGVYSQEKKLTDEAQKRSQDYMASDEGKANEYLWNHWEGKGKNNKVNPIDTITYTDPNTGKNIDKTVDLSKISPTQNELKDMYKTLNDPKDIAQQQVYKDKHPVVIIDEDKLKTKASGGYVNHGVYELGELGTETVLTAEQTQVLRNNILSNRPDSLISLLKSYNEAYHGLSQNAYDSISNTASEIITIERAEVNLQIEKLADDYDSRRAANTIMDEMLRIASKTKANNSVRR